MRTIVTRYRAVEFVPGKWRIENREGTPLWEDNDPCEPAKPVVIDSEDAALDCVARLNAEAKELDE